jgi:hypothetical protein
MKERETDKQGKKGGEDIKNEERRNKERRDERCRNEESRKLRVCPTKILLSLSWIIWQYHSITDNFKGVWIYVTVSVC